MGSCDLVSANIRSIPKSNYHAIQFHSYIVTCNTNCSIGSIRYLSTQSPTLRIVFEGLDALATCPNVHSFVLLNSDFCFMAFWLLLLIELQPLPIFFFFGVNVVRACVRACVCVLWCVLNMSVSK